MLLILALGDRQTDNWGSLAGEFCGHVHLFHTAAMSSSPKLGGLGPHKCIPPCSRCSGGTLPQPQFLVGTSIPWLPWPGASHWDLHLALLLSVCLLSVCLSFDSALHLFSLGFSRHLP